VQWVNAKIDQLNLAIQQEIQENNNA